VPGTIAGLVNQFVLVDQSPSVEPSQMSLVALPVVGKSANALKKSRDEMLLERMRHFTSGERIATEERLRRRSRWKKADNHHAGRPRNWEILFPFFARNRAVEIERTSLQIAFDARRSPRASYARSTRAQ
jgi:hypothetical protein